MKKKRSRQSDYKPLCNDCGVDVLRTGNWYMATPDLWEKKLGLGWNDNLCIACLEKRLGRKAKAWKDIAPVFTSIGSERTTPAIDGDFTREREGAAMIDVALMIVVIGAVVIAVLVDVAALVSWLRRRRS